MIGMLVGALVFIAFDVLDVIENALAALNRKLSGK
jgi:hypothetical protein